MHGAEVLTGRVSGGEMCGAVTRARLARLLFRWLGEELGVFREF